MPKYIKLKFNAAILLVTTLSQSVFAQTWKDNVKPNASFQDIQQAFNCYWGL